MQDQADSRGPCLPGRDGDPPTQDSEVPSAGEKQTCDLLETANGAISFPSPQSLPAGFITSLSQADHLDPERPGDLLWATQLSSGRVVQSGEPRALQGHRAQHTWAWVSRPLHAALVRQRGADTFETSEAPGLGAHATVWSHRMTRCSPPPVAPCPQPGLCLTVPCPSPASEAKWI